MARIWIPADNPLTRALRGFGAPGDVPLARAIAQEFRDVYAIVDPRLNPNQALGTGNVALTTVGMRPYQNWFEPASRNDYIRFPTFKPEDSAFTLAICFTNFDSGDYYKYASWATMFSSNFVEFAASNDLKNFAGGTFSNNTRGIGQQFVGIWGVEKGAYGAQDGYSILAINNNGANEYFESNTHSPFYTRAGQSNDFYFLNNYDNLTRSPLATGHFCLLDNKQWSIEKAERFARNPLSLYEPADQSPILIGTAAAGGGTQTINADFVSSASTIYQPSVTGGAGTVTADFIASASVIYQPDVTTAGIIQADFIASASAIYDPTVSGGPGTVNADFISSASSIYQPVLTAGATINADFIASASAIYDPAVTGGAGTVSADFISSASVIYDPSVFGAAGTITADFIASASAIYQPTMSSVATISADFIASSSQIFQPGVIGGAGTIDADFITSGSIIFQPSVGSLQTIDADFISSASQVFQPTMGGLWTEIPSVSTTWTEI